MEHEREVCTFSVSFETPPLSVFDLEEEEGDGVPKAGPELWPETRLLFESAV